MRGKEEKRGGGTNRHRKRGQLRADGGRGRAVTEPEKV